ncbi:hypothetical protein EDC01DRAFT_114977 [Geopyxis carbonaria]|nr:hypothetical protein EDC01DRAFT_114977 [Geopyxis carbonaria]
MSKKRKIEKVKPSTLKRQRKRNSQSAQNLPFALQPKKQKQKKPIQHQNLFNPFLSSDDILLVGDGDFSFAATLSSHPTLAPRSLTATSYDSLPTVFQKYPQAEQHLEQLSACKVFHDIDATKLHGYRPLRHTKYTKIAFLFPHVGGLTKDQNRQIRANQLMLTGFFQSLCKGRGLLQPGGKVVVTLFEGLPYELWDLKGIAKNAGFYTERSGQWNWDEWKGYEHRRTLGNIEGKGSAWLGKQRKARCYVFGVIGEEKVELNVKNIDKDSKQEHDSELEDEQE